jgi:hypothetical protein
VAFLAQQLRNHLYHGYVIIHQKDFGHRRSLEETRDGGQAEPAATPQEPAIYSPGGRPRFNRHRHDIGYTSQV